jgi:hypothetical protein
MLSKSNIRIFNKIKNFANENEIKTIENMSYLLKSDDISIMEVYLNLIFNKLLRL